MRKRWVIAGIVVLALAAGYTGYWVWLARTFERNLALWIDQQRAMGYRISFSAGEPQGYPLPIRIRLTDVAVQAPGGRSPWRFETDSMRLGIAPWRPLMLTIDDGQTKPQYRLRLAAAGRMHDLSIEGLSLDLDLPANGAPLAVRIRKQSIGVSRNGRPIADLGQFFGNVEVSQARSHDESSIRFELAADAIDFHLPPPTETVETYFWQLSGKVMGQIPPAPLPSALASWSRDGGYLEVAQLKADWEAVARVNFEGSGALDPQLQPVASMTARLSNYPDLIDWLATLGILTPSQATATKFALAAKSRPDADGRMEAQVPFTIQDGYVSVGAMKIAQVPRIEWR
jgi:hypothetical protein